MDKTPKIPPANEGAARGTTASYVSGFVLSLLLTLTAYFLVVQHKNSVGPSLSHRYLLVAIIILAITQLFIQLLFFLHLDRESKPRWNLLVASFAAIVVIILVAGSLWIMNNLNYHMEAPTQLDKTIIKDEGVHQ
jgi:cytochrome o ubiquinol oxidase subunit IV